MKLKQPTEKTLAGAEMRKLREAAGLSQPQFGELLSLGEGAYAGDKVSKYERNEYPVPPTVLLLARIVGDPQFRERWLRKLQKEKKE